MRGEAFTNKLMAKKRNFVKYNERFKKKLMIEKSKLADSFGGLGRVGLDHDGKRVDCNGDEIEEDLVPGFSTSALKFITKNKEEDEEVAKNS